MFGLKVISEFDSKYSGKLRVIQSGRSLYLTAAGLTQSGGVVKDVWQAALKPGRSFKESPFKASWLILGLGAGTVAKIIADKYQPRKIVGVEIDPAMLALGRRYFALDQIPNLEILKLDARRYVLEASEIFDFVLVDLYLGDQLPPFVYRGSFLRQVGKRATVAIFNHLFFDAEKKAQAGRLVQALSCCFATIRLHRVLTNLLIVCS